MNNSQFLSKCSADVIEKAASQLVAGHLVAFPTETVYGLGADASSEAAVRRIYEVKGRPVDHPLIVHISSTNLLDVWASAIPEYALKLARDFWPGPMTLVLKRTSEAKDFITGGQDSVAIRVPNNPIALSLLRSFESKGGKGVAAPSANRFGQVSPTSSDDVISELSSFLMEGDLILDGGKCDVGIESTIIDCSNTAPLILRPGAITNEMLETSTGIGESENTLSDIRVSGGLEKHYAPRAKVTLDEIPQPGQGFIALASIPTPEGVIRIANPKDIVEFGQILYESLRKADILELKELVVTQPIGGGLAIGVRDRLKKASNGR
jgi:L-threonylcarbamoyladenylate synthase